LRKSIALLITLMFLSIVIVIIGSVFNIYDKLVKQSSFYKDIAQNSLIIRDIENILSNISNNINSTDDLNILFRTFQINLNDKIINVKISPLFDKVNINELLKKKSVKRYIYNICEDYMLKDIQYFLNLLEDTIDTDLEERNYLSEIKLINKNFQNGKIYSYKHLKKIVQFYAQKTGDKNIFNIPWKKFIYFADNKVYPIDCDRLGEKKAKYLGLIFNMYSCKEIKRYEENKKIIKNLDIISFNKNKPYFIEIMINYDKQKIDIIYDLNSKKAINIEYSAVY